MRNILLRTHSVLVWTSAEFWRRPVKKAKALPCPHVFGALSFDTAEQPLSKSLLTRRDRFVRPTAAGDRDGQL